MISSLHHTTKRLIGLEKKAFCDEDAFKDILECSLGDVGDNAYKTAVLQAYNEIYRNHKKITDEGKL